MKTDSDIGATVAGYILSLIAVCALLWAAWVLNDWYEALK
jgi:hypothetical protein